MPRGPQTTLTVFHTITRLRHALAHAKALLCGGAGRGKVIFEHRVHGSKGMEYSPSANALDHVSKVNDMAALHPGSIGGPGEGFVKSGRVKIVDTGKIERPFGFITIGEPQGKVKKVIEAYRKEADIAE